MDETTATDKTETVLDLTGRSGPPQTTPPATHAGCLADFVHPHDAERLAEAIQQAAEQRQDTVVRVRAAGGWAEVRCTLIPVDTRENIDL